MGLGGEDALWPLSVHDSAGEVGLVGPDTPFGFAGTGLTWLEGVALASPSCMGIIPSVEWLVRALPTPGAKVKLRRNTMKARPAPPPTARLGRRAAIQGNVTVTGEGRWGGPDALLQGAVRDGCGWDPHTAFACGLGATPPPNAFWQAITRCYGATPPALARSPFSVQIMWDGGGKVSLVLRPLPPRAAVLTAATTHLPRQRHAAPWGPKQALILRLNCSDTAAVWASGLWRWFAATSAAHAPDL